MPEHHRIIIVGAGPGGLAVAAALHDEGVEDVVILEKGEIGESWREYPTDTHLISESAPNKDDNMIAGVSTSEVFPHIPHPNHMMYQKYLEYVATEKKIQVKCDVMVEKVLFDQTAKIFHLMTKTGEEFTAQFVVWSGGMYSTPNQMVNSEGCYIHYANFPYMDYVTSDEITVVGSANGASGVVMQLAKPGRLITLVVSHKYEIPMPIDCLWKENMQFILDLSKQGLVKIVENFRVSRVFEENGLYVLENEEGKQLTAKRKPIVCIGFSPNIEPIKDMVEEYCEHHETFFVLDEAHQSKKQPGLYVAGCIGKLEPSEGMIVVFREFGPIIAKHIHDQIPNK